MRLSALIAANPQMAFVAIDPATGKGVERVIDDPCDQGHVENVVVRWLRAGAKVWYMTSDSVVDVTDAPPIAESATDVAEHRQPLNVAHTEQQLP